MKRFAIVEMSPIRSPAWRWQLALEFLQGRERRLSRWDDPWFRRAVFYLRSLGPRDPRSRRNSRPDPAIVGAMSLFRTAQPSRSLRIEARVLAGQTPEEIAAIEDQPLGVVEAYEALFFDVRGRLHASSYIRNFAVGLDPDTARPRSWPAFVRAVAYEGGPHVLDAAFRSALPIPRGVPVDPLTRQFRCLWLLQQSSAETLSPILWVELQRLAAERPGFSNVSAPAQPAARLAALVARSPAADPCAEAETAPETRRIG